MVAITYPKIANRPSVAGAVLQTPPWLIHSFIHWLSHPFPPNLQDIINPKPLELGSWNFACMFTLYHVLYVTCQVSGVRCHMSGLFSFLFFFFGQSGGACLWRVCYQRGLPRLIFLLIVSSFIIFNVQNTLTLEMDSEMAWNRYFCLKQIVISQDIKWSAILKYSANSMILFPPIWIPKQRLNMKAYEIMIWSCYNLQLLLLVSALSLWVCYT